MKLTDLINIGSALSKKLIAADITTPETLIELGSFNAFMRLKLNDPSQCIFTLMALEGAIQGVKWNHLSDADKAELKQLIENLDANN